MYHESNTAIIMTSHTDISRVERRKVRRNMHIFYFWNHTHTEDNDNRIFSF